MDSYDIKTATGTRVAMTITKTCVLSCDSVLHLTEISIFTHFFLWVKFPIKQDTSQNCDSHLMNVVRTFIRPTLVPAISSLLNQN